MTLGNGSAALVSCYLSATTTAAEVIEISSTTVVYGCYITGGAIGATDFGRQCRNRQLDLR